MKKHKLVNIAKALGKIVVIFFLFLHECFLVLTRCLFASADTTDKNEASDNAAKNEASDNAAKGGVLNYRTGKFDNGTKATGWYDNN